MICLSAKEPQIHPSKMSLSFRVCAYIYTIHELRSIKDSDPKIVDCFCYLLVVRSKCLQLSQVNYQLNTQVCIKRLFISNIDLTILNFGPRISNQVNAGW